MLNEKLAPLTVPDPPAFAPPLPGLLTVMLTFPVAVWPWLLTMLVFLVFVTYVPAISLWLPRLLGMMG